MRARYIKISLWIVALVLVWQFGHSYSVTDTLLLFAAAGVVPGTNIVLQPDQVFVLLGGMLVLAFFLIFGTNLLRAARFLLTKPQQTATPLAEATATDTVATIAEVPLDEPTAEAKQSKRGRKKTKVPVPVAVIALPKQPSVLSRMTVVLVAVLTPVVGRMRTAIARVAHMALVAARQRFPQVMTALLVASRIITQTARQLRQQTIQQTSRLRQWALPHVRRAAGAVRGAIIRVAITVGRQAVTLWRWSEPRLRQFDAWLGAQLHKGKAIVGKNETVTAGRHLVREINKVIAAWRAEMRAAVTRVVEK